MMIASPAVSAGPTFSNDLPRGLEEACRALEEEFAQIVFGKMRQAMIPKSSKGTDFGQETASSMLDQQWAHLASQGEGLGLWRALYRQVAPTMIKSGETGTDENGGGESLNRTQARHADAKRGPGALDHRLGHPEAGRIAPTDARVPRLSEQEEQRPLRPLGKGPGDRGRKGR